MSAVQRFLRMHINSGPKTFNIQSYVRTSDQISRLGLRLNMEAWFFFESLRSCLSIAGYRSWWQAYCLETLNTGTIMRSKISVMKRVLCLLYLQVRSNQRR